MARYSASRHHHRWHVERVRADAGKHTHSTGVADTIAGTKVLEKHPARPARDLDIAVAPPRGDAKWLVPLGLSTAALIATDRRTADALDDNRTRLNVSHAVSYIGSGYGAGSIAGAFYLIGRATHNARARETGLLGGEALIDSGIVAFVIKHATQRPRPRAGKERGDFFHGGLSFPSGHTIAAWSLATVVANEYRDKRLVQISAYGLAAAVSVSRYTGRNHFLSDVLVGSAIGYGIGRYVYRTHHDPAPESTGQEPPRAPSKLLPLIIPRYERARRDYGVALVWSF